MATDDHPLDPEVRQRVAELLYGLLPALYRVRDEPPKGRGDLRRFLSVLAAPLAEVRQSVESLQADLFIDSARDALLPYLAEMVGTALVFPDAASNRRDVRGTASWRRSKGTPDTLESLATGLFDQLVSTQEGWKRLLVTQDVNALRPERTVPDVRDALLAEASSGPLDATFHALSHVHHPRHVEHWLHPTRLFPVRDGYPGVLGSAGSNYTFHPLQLPRALRVRSGEGPADAVRTDRLPTEHFARTPERFFGEGKSFQVRVCGLPAAVAHEEAPSRQPSSRSADMALVQGPATLTLLEHGTRGWTGRMRVELFAVPLEAAGAPSAWRPKLDDRSFRGGVTLAREGAADASGGFSAVAGPCVPMLRLAPLPPDGAGRFPGATVELAADVPRARLASGDPALAAEGFLRGALNVRLPETWVEQALWLHVAADGSVREAVRDGEPLLLRESGAFFLLEGEALATGPGAAWPPASPCASDELLSRIPPSSLRGPVLMHGGRPMLSSAENAPPDARWALAFALRYPSRYGARYQPILRLEWNAGLGMMAWSPIDTQGRPVTPAQRFPRLSRLVDLGLEGAQLVARLEGDRTGLVLPPCEVAWTLESGETVLLHLPTLTTLRAAKREPRWKTQYAATGAAVGFAVDGSSRWPESGRIARYALGAPAVAPLSGPLTLRRRRVRGCHLDLPGRAGHLDLDPSRGQFAFAAQEPPQEYPHTWFVPDDTYLRRASVTVDYLEGYSGHVGARPAPREPLLGARQPTPTRIVSARGVSRVPGVPQYDRLSSALNAIQLDPSPAPHEVIQFEDSASYLFGWEYPWPRNVKRLTLQAAEGERPVFLTGFRWILSGEALYERLTLRGLCLGWLPLVLPRAEVVDVQFCSVGGDGGTLVFQSPNGKDMRVEVLRSVTAGLELRGTGVLSVKDSVVDAGGGQALLAPEATCELERVTVLGSTQVLALEASEVIFDGPVQVTDRFHGCIRYSRVPEGAVLPRRHHVLEGTEVCFVTRDRFDPAHARLAEDCDPAITRGAEDGSEPGAFHHVRLVQRLEALARRLTEFTPAGLTAGITRLD